MRRLPVLLVAALLATACGSDDGGEERASKGSSEPTATTGTSTTPEDPGSSESGGDTLPADEWAKRVTKLCEDNRARAAREVARIQQEIREEGGSREDLAARVLEESPEITAPFLKASEELPPPEGLEDEAKEFFGLLDKTKPLFEDAADAIRSRDEAEVRRVTEEIRETALPARDLARKLGIPGCNPTPN
jgi:hypothetical protein